MSAPAMDRPRGLWSLWEMLDKHAFLFGVANAKLTDLVGRCTRARLLSPDVKVWAPDDGNLRYARDAILDLRRALILSEMQDAMPQVMRLEDTMKEAVLIERFQNDLSNLLLRIFDDLRNEFYFHVDQRDVPFYGQKDAFGLTRSGKFDGVLSDVEAAGNCIALHQSTAAVFHLMRVMERAVHVLGSKLGVKFDPAKQGWYEICNSAGKAATNRPAKNAKQRSTNAALGAAVAHLQTVRLAWRNEVMHPKQTYTRDEALEVYNATRTFMTHLAGLV